MSEIISTVIMCQGPPRCDLAGDEAVENQKAGCIWCARLDIYDDGTERLVEPHEA